MESISSDFFRWFYEQCAWLCHQMDSRSLMIAGVALPVCTRCTGIYLGAAHSFTIRFSWKNRKAIYHFNPLFWVLTAISFILMIADALAGPLIYGYPHAIRFITGYGFGFLAMTTLAEWTKRLVFDKDILEKKAFKIQSLGLNLISGLVIVSGIFFLFASELWLLILTIIIIGWGIVMLYATVDTVLFFWIMSHLRHRCQGSLCLTAAWLIGLVIFIIQMLAIQWFEISL